jgi:proteasome lid subunit RPN8/RPN11
MEEAPKEACGLRIARRNLVKVMRLRNTAEDPCRTYSFDVRTLRVLVEEDVIHSQDRLSFWHTHPGGNIGPSPEDLQSKVDGVDYLVVTIPSGEVEWF